ncbi:hypothetical protein ACFO3O_00685 [Dokdonia ponticola]|uniref:Uncharacterized protein n=1 Tax=Dokdonia ponticola TaxID=2041041 RepID=A0ABV9HTS4_9FLAO
MNIQAEKIELAKLLLSTNNPEIIQSIRQIFKKEKATDFWDDLSSEQQAEIVQGITEIQEGKVTDYNSFMVNHR